MEEKSQSPPVVPLLNLSREYYVLPGTEVKLSLNKSEPSVKFIKDLVEGKVYHVFAAFGIQKGELLERLSEVGVYCSIKHTGKDHGIILEGQWRGIILSSEHSRGYTSAEVEKLEDEPIDQQTYDLCYEKLNDSLNSLAAKKIRNISQKKAKDLSDRLKALASDPQELANLIWAIIIFIPDLDIYPFLVLLQSQRLTQRMIICSIRLNETLERALSKQASKDQDIDDSFIEELKHNPQLVKRYIAYLEILPSLPEDARIKIIDDLDHLKSLQRDHTEYPKYLSHLDAALALPWNKETEQETDIEKVAEKLNKDHSHLQLVKEKIYEFVASKILNPKGKADILCFIGPPGVGKTSLGESIARALNRKFVRMSVGGMHDESRIRGHSFTYVGSQPGDILKLLRRCGVRNPAFMIDEIDKIGRLSAQGDPAAALLEVLDPEQNHSFVDNYLGIGFDLSRILFICTANVEDDIPEPLRNRMNIIRLPGYLDVEKLEIAKSFLIPKAREAAGLVGKVESIFEDNALLYIISGYTKEAGVRGLTQGITDILRKQGVIYLKKGRNVNKVTPDTVESLLGLPKFVLEEARPTEIGEAIGLAWTPYGGQILRIQSVFFSKSGDFIISQTGQLQDVMREADKVAVTLARNKLTQEETLRISGKSLHLHIPEGAIKKDGPSAGITAFSSVYSRFTGRKLRSHIAMTGEIDLMENILPVGGIPEKVIAAVRVGIKELVLPKTNERNLKELPREARKEIESKIKKSHFVKTVDEVIDIGFEPAV